MLYEYVNMFAPSCCAASTIPGSDDRGDTASSPPYKCDTWGRNGTPHAPARRPPGRQRHTPGGGLCVYKAPWVNSAGAPTPLNTATDESAPRNRGAPARAQSDTSSIEAHDHRLRHRYARLCNDKRTTSQKTRSARLGARDLHRSQAPSGAASRPACASSAACSRAATYDVSKYSSQCLARGACTASGDRPPLAPRPTRRRGAHREVGAYLTMARPGVVRFAVPKVARAGATLTELTEGLYPGPGEMLVELALVMSTGTLPW